MGDRSNISKKQANKQDRKLIECKERERRRKRNSEWYKKYRKTKKGRVTVLLTQYKKRKGSDYTVKELMEQLDLPCFYCGTIDDKRGLDRIDNSLGHTKANTVSACWTCNRVRGSDFTQQEMLIIGPVVRKILNDRRDATTQNGDHLAFSTSHPKPFGHDKSPQSA